MTNISFNFKHQYNRPTWKCAECREDWPCSTARIALLWRFCTRLPDLRARLGADILDALTDLDNSHDRAALYERFFGWVNRAEADQAVKVHLKG